MVPMSHYVKFEDLRVQFDYFETDSLFHIKAVFSKKTFTMVPTFQISSCLNFENGTTHLTGLWIYENKMLSLNSSQIEFKPEST